MDVGTLFWILLIGGGVAGMLFMHRGGHAHGGAGGGGGCGGHAARGGHGGQTPTDEPRESPKTEEAPVGKPGSHDQSHKPAAAGSKHRGC